MINNFKSTYAVIMTSQPKNEILQSSFYFKITCLIVMKICIHLLKNYKTYGKNFQIAQNSNCDVTPKKLSITIKVFITKLHAC